MFRPVAKHAQVGLPIDEALFFGGRDKGPLLDAFGTDIFFDYSPANVESARKHIATGHVPHGDEQPKLSIRQNFTTRAHPRR
jgi:hypothetical protein